MFVGSLYLQKGIANLLSAYKLTIDEGVAMPVLKIIGDGPERSSIERLITENSLERKVQLLGAIINEEELGRHFHSAIMCVSPDQAGLSVQKAFSYGVPFVTSHYPISGGEFSCIIDGVTGFFYDGSVAGLARKMAEIVQLPEIDSVHQNCKTFYERYRSPEVWLQGFSKAIDYVTSKH